MTSPTQLKYLEAIGIPVWVSRDLVIGEEQEPENIATVDAHVDSILHDLEAQQKVVAPVRQPVQEKTQQSAPVVPAQKVHSAKPQANEIAQSALHVVYGSGNIQADWMVIGESPELNNDRLNQPYAGDSGVLLGNMLRAVGIDNPRENAYLLNTLKLSVATTPELEQQSSQELLQILLAKIEEVKPKILLAVGQIAAQRLLQSKEPLARLRGKEHCLPNTQIPLVVTYYPSYLLSKPSDKRKAWEDLKLAMKILAR